MYIHHTYNFHGSHNSGIWFFAGEEADSVKLLTDYREEIATVHTIDDLKQVIEDLLDDKYA